MFVTSRFATTYLSLPTPSSIYGGFTDRMFFAHLYERHDAFFQIPEIEQILRDKDLEFDELLQTLKKDHWKQRALSKRDVGSFPSTALLLSLDTPESDYESFNQYEDKGTAMLPPPFQPNPLVQHFQNHLYDLLSEDEPDFDIYEFIRTQLEGYIDLVEYHLRNLHKVAIPRALWAYTERTRFAKQYFHDPGFLNFDTGYNYDLITSVLNPESYNVTVRVMIPDIEIRAARVAITAFRPTFLFNTTCKIVTNPPELITTRSLPEPFNWSTAKNLRVTTNQYCLNWSRRPACASRSVKKLRDIPRMFKCEE